MTRPIPGLVAGSRLRGRAAQFRHAVLALSLTAAISACTARQDKSPDSVPAQEPSSKAAEPMGTFARLVGGEWRQTAQSGKSMFHTWHWGPGKHSVRRMTDGSGAGGEPWREVQVFYWHPAHKQVRGLGVSPFARGVSEGTITFEGETAEGVFDLHQTGGRRGMGLRWAFDGPDKYRETLLERSGPGGLKPLVEWEHVRSKPPATPRPRTVEGAKPSDRLDALGPLLGHTWEADRSRATIEWVPLADAVYARVVGKDGEHLLDAYVYHHTGADVLRCLALSRRGGVYEGDLAVLDGGALQLDLKGSEGDRRVVRFDFEKDGAVRQRDWSLTGTDRTLLLDVHHRKLPARGSKPAGDGQISQYVRRLFQDKAGNYWFGTNDEGVCRYDGKEFVYLSKKDGLAGNAVRGILQDDAGHVWFATDGGVSRYDGRSFTNFTTRDGLKDNDVWSMLRDRKGNLWFGTMAGVSRYDGKTFDSVSVPRADVPHRSRFNPDLVWGIAEDRTGNLWFGTDGGGARKFDGSTFTVYTTKDGLAGNNVRCIVPDRAGNIWLGTQDGGVSRYDGKAFTTFTEKDGLSSNDVWTALADTRGNLWFGTPGGGVCRYDGKSFASFTDTSGLTRNHVQSIFEDRDGVIWFGFSGGAFRFDGKGLVNFTKNAAKP